MIGRATGIITAAMTARWVVLVALLATGCDDLLENMPCSGAIGSCSSQREALFCVDGRYTRLACSGPAGCSEQGGNFRCDQSVAAVGDRCASEDTAACTADLQSYLVCENGRYVMHAHCRGANHCQNGAGRVTCDETIAEPDDPCGAGGAACSPSHDAFLRCTEGRFVESLRCRGPEGCHIDGTRVLCDQSLAAVGDVCDAEGAATCSTDRASLLRCRGGVLVQGVTCRGPRHCYEEGTMVRCDEPVGAVGNACADEGGHLCDADGTHDLVCRNGVIQLDGACPGGCALRNGRVSCR